MTMNKACELEGRLQWRAAAKEWRRIGISGRADTCDRIADAKTRGDLFRARVDLLESRGVGYRRALEIADHVTYGKPAPAGYPCGPAEHVTGREYFEDAGVASRLVYSVDPVSAARAYPRLIEALRQSITEDNAVGMRDAGKLAKRRFSEINEDARALLRELGEL